MSCRTRKLFLHFCPSLINHTLREVNIFNKRENPYFMFELQKKCFSLISVQILMELILQLYLSLPNYLWTLHNIVSSLGKRKGQRTIRPVPNVLVLGLVRNHSWKYDELCLRTLNWKRKLINGNPETWH